MNHHNVPVFIRIIMLDRRLSRADDMLMNRFFFPFDEIAGETPAVHAGIVAMAREVNPELTACVEREAKRSLRERVRDCGAIAGFVIWKIAGQANRVRTLVEDVNSRASDLARQPEESDRAIKRVLRVERSFRVWLAIFEILYIPDAPLSWALYSPTQGAPWWPRRGPE